MLGCVQVFLGYQKLKINCRLSGFLSGFRDVSGTFLQVFVKKKLVFYFVAETRYEFSASNLESDFSWSASPSDANLLISCKFHAADLSSEMYCRLTLFVSHSVSSGFSRNKLEPCMIPAWRKQVRPLTI